MKKIVLLLCTLICANVLMAQTRFTIDSIIYEVIDSNEVKIYDYEEEAEKIASEMQRKADKPKRMILIIWVCIVLFFVAMFLTMMFRGM